MRRKTPKYHLGDVLKYGYWKGQVIKDLIDKIPDTFAQHLDNYPYLYDEDVYDYLREIMKDKYWIDYTEFESIQEYNRMLAMPNT